MDRHHIPRCRGRRDMMARGLPALHAVARNHGAQRPIDMKSHGAAQAPTYYHRFTF